VMAASFDIFLGNLGSKSVKLESLGRKTSGTRIIKSFHSRFLVEWREFNSAKPGIGPSLGPGAFSRRKSRVCSLRSFSLSITL